MPNLTAHFQIAIGAPPGYLAVLNSRHHPVDRAFQAELKRLKLFGSMMKLYTLYLYYASVAAFGRNHPIRPDEVNIGLRIQVWATRI